MGLRIVYDTQSPLATQDVFWYNEVLQPFYSTANLTNGDVSRTQYEQTLAVIDCVINCVCLRYLNTCFAKVKW